MMHLEFGDDGHLTLIIEGSDAFLPFGRVIKGLKVFVSEPENSIWITGGRE